MEVESVGSEDRDRLSELPHSLILHILSFMSMRDVVSTTFLSKRWNKLWTTVPCFNIRECMSEENKMERVRNFVNRALILWKGTKILKFEIDIESGVVRASPGDIDVWVRFAVEHNVEELNIHLRNHLMEIDWKNPIVESKRDAYWAPQCLNSCSSIRKLSLMGCNLHIDVSPPWDQLKRLKIYGFCFSECLINRILLGSPNLEAFELRLMENFENLNIQSSSLKELKIIKHLYALHFLDRRDTVLRIRCPNLENLQLLGALYSNLNISSLGGRCLVSCRRNVCLHHYRMLSS